MSRCTVPELWSSSVKDTLHASRAERHNTQRMCTQIKRLLSESSNEIWQHANVATNALTANVNKIQRQKLISVDQLTLVRDTNVLYVASRPQLDSLLSTKRGPLLRFTFVHIHPCQLTSCVGRRTLCAVCGYVCCRLSDVSVNWTASCS